MLPLLIKKEVSPRLGLTIRYHIIFITKQVQREGGLTFMDGFERWMSLHCSPKGLDSHSLCLTLTWHAIYVKQAVDYAQCRFGK